MQPLILYIETSESACSVCLAKGLNIVAEKQHHEANSHATVLANLVKALFEESNLHYSELNAVAISAGPGSYTGLRIGTSFAKGICYANNIPLIAISTLKAMAASVIKAEKNNLMFFCPMIDARRMEVYCGVFNKNLKIILPEQPVILNEETVIFFDFSNTLFFGSGAEKVLRLHENANIYKGFNLKATDFIAEANNAYAEKQFADLAYFEPNYIKAFYSTANISA